MDQRDFENRRDQQAAFPGCSRWRVRNGGFAASTVIVGVGAMSTGRISNTLT